MAAQILLDALIWETEECIYLVKINKITPKVKPVADDDDEDFEDDDEHEQAQRQRDQLDFGG